uniref:Uridine phosphorylase 1 n=1 Tax=Aceria tosichella TaxID=561515 RepID=A0A6G1SGQ5_9ACAR
MPEVNYHHFSLTFHPNEVEQRFKDVRFVLVAGCSERVEAQAHYLAEKLFDGVKGVKYPLEQLTKSRSRFTLFKLGPCLLSNHGMGCASMSIALHELFLMCQKAKVINLITVLRFGTCGGIGVPAGTICITNRALDPLFQDFVELKICMKLVKRPCAIDMPTVATLDRLCKEHPNREELGDYQVSVGATIASNDFYEEQGRTNGAICEHTIEDKMRFLERARELGVINMEMECNHLAAMCHKLGVSFGILDVALTNRLSNDKVELSREQMLLFERRLFWLNLVFIRHKLFGGA